MIQRRSSGSSLTCARELVHDLYEPRPAIYWTDFLASMVVGYAAGGLYLSSPLTSPVAWIALAVAIVALYRLSSFMHEIVHFKKHQMRGFRITWNLLAGVPLLTPSTFYENHIAHHNARHYGTSHDGEYLPLAHGTAGEIALYLLQVFLQPIGVLLRFLLAPLTFVHPRLRRWVLEHASSFVINFRYRHPVPDDAPHKARAALELACSLRAWLIFVWIGAGLTPWTQLPKLYMLAMLILSLNHLRTLGAHLYRSHGLQMTHEQQLLDSTNIRGGWLTELLCPVGLRYHALHHLFPALPYHNLAAAHRRLMKYLPREASYRQVEYPTFRAVLREFLAYRREAVQASGDVTVAHPLSRTG